MNLSVELKRWKSIINEAAFVLSKYLLWAIFIVLAYSFFTYVDGRYFRPILEMGMRNAGPITHITTDKEYCPGAMVWARTQFHKNRNIVGTIRWHLLNKRVYDYPSRPGSLPVMVFDKEVRVETIPPEATEGTHWFVGTVSYKIYPFSRSIEFPLLTNDFQVVNKKDCQ